ncbi:hypothetical protein ACHAXT_006020 [Thalassiosira profunda]
MSRSRAILIIATLAIALTEALSSMSKTILITGATDGIGLATARALAAKGHALIVHGRSAAKLTKVEAELTKVTQVATVQADLSDLSAVRKMAKSLATSEGRLDVLINNAGVFVTSSPRTSDGHDVRFVVNTFAPYILADALIAKLGPAGRIVNLSSAAQSPVDANALAGNRPLSDGAAYAQSKLALTMWTHSMGEREKAAGGPMVVSVNPGSFLGTKMVRSAYGAEGKDISQGSDILVQAALSKKFAGAHGKYFDNDAGRFARPHPDACDLGACRQLEETMKGILISIP